MVGDSKGGREGGRSIFVLDSYLTDYIIVLGMFVILHNRELLVLVEKMVFFLTEASVGH